MDRRTFLTTAAGLSVASVSDAAPAPAAEPHRHPYRQVHLDFHTSELIPDVGIDFDPEEFTATLQRAHVNSINVFAKCHHGLAYYPTKIGTPHPNLKKDMLGGMTKSLRKAGIAVNYYYSLVWDVNQARRHPEWLMVNAAGEPMTGPPKNNWPWLCLNSPYFDQVVAENREILDRFDVDGCWYDILKTLPEGCHCRWCKADRAKLGLRDTEADLTRHNKLTALKVERVLGDLAKAKQRDLAIFFNSRLVIGLRDELPNYSHVELESLPTGGWGYTHFQQRVRYYRTLGKPMIGMTGRFHKSWGDFGGLKNQAALDYECLNFLANGTRVCVGDQLHPRGRLDQVTYERIGHIYERIEGLEPWLAESTGAADIGVLSAAARDNKQATTAVPPVDQGFTSMLVELHQQFDILDLESDLSRYSVVILPDEAPANDAFLARVREFVRKGGALLASHEGLADPDLLGVRVHGPAKFAGEYMVLKPAAFPGIAQTPYYLYQRGKSIEALPGTEVLATYGHPYFDRTPEHFSSHKQTPMDRVTDEPLITRRGRVVYIANPFFRSYSQDGYGIQKLVVEALLKQLLPKPAMVTRNVPSTAQVTVMRQPSRTLVHVLHYPLTRRAPDIDIIEEPAWVENAEVRVRLDRRPSKVSLIPQRQSLEFGYEEGYATVALPRILGHQAIAFEA